MDYRVGVFHKLYKESVNGLGHCKLQAHEVCFTKHVSTASEKKTVSNKTVFFFFFGNRTLLW